MSTSNVSKAQPRYTVNEVIHGAITPEHEEEYWQSMLSALERTKDDRLTEVEFDAVVARLSRSLGLLLLNEEQHPRLLAVWFAPSLFRAVSHHPHRDAVTDRLLLEGWCEHVLFTLAWVEASSRHKFFVTFRTLYEHINWMVQEPDVPLSLAGKLWRATDKTHDQGVLRELALALMRRDGMPATFAVKLHMARFMVGIGMSKQAWLMKEEALFQRAVAEHPGLEGLPFDLVVGVLLTQDPPEEWWGEDEVSEVLKPFWGDLEEVTW